MTVKELKAELECYDEDAEIVFEFNDEIEVDSWTEDRWGNRKVSIDKHLEITFSGDIRDYCWIELGAEKE